MSDDIVRGFKTALTYLGKAMADAPMVLNEPGATAVMDAQTGAVSSTKVLGTTALAHLPNVISGIFGIRSAQSEDPFVSASGVISVASSAASSGASLAGSASGGIGAGGVAAGALATVAGFLSMGSMVTGQFVAMGADAHAGIEHRGAEGATDGYYLGFAAGITDVAWSKAKEALDPFADPLTTADGSPTQNLASASYTEEFKASFERGYREANAMSPEAKTEYQMCMYGFLERMRPFVSRAADLDITIVHALVATAKQATTAACLRTFHDTDADGELDSSGPPGSSAADLAAGAAAAEQVCEAALEGPDASDGPVSGVDDDSLSVGGTAEVTEEPEDIDDAEDADEDDPADDPIDSASAFSGFPAAPGPFHPAPSDESTFDPVPMPEPPAGLVPPDTQPVPMPEPPAGLVPPDTQPVPMPDATEWGLPDDGDEDEDELTLPDDATDADDEALSSVQADDVDAMDYPDDEGSMSYPDDGEGAVIDLDAQEVETDVPDEVLESTLADDAGGSVATNPMSGGLGP